MNIKKVIYQVLGSLYVVLDDTDNSVTLSPRLAEIVMADINNDNRIHLFKVKDNGREAYAFTVNNSFLSKKKAPASPLQKNLQHGTVGFNAYNPSVNYIYYHQGLPLGKTAKRKVSVKKRFGLTYYQF